MTSGQAEMDTGTGIDLCIVIPPFDQIKLPLLGPAILTAACRDRGLSVRNVFGNIMLGARVGYQPYKAVARYYLDCVIGERLFRPYAWPPEIAARLPELPKLSPTADALHEELAPQIGIFMDDFTAAVLALRPRIVAITSTFEQVMAGSAIALRIREAAPGTVIVMGGANIAAPMGAAYAGVFPWIDHFFSGEADVAFPDFCERLIRTGERPSERVIECQPVDDISVSPTPDFDDYMTALRAEQAKGTVPDHLPEGLPLESSRGCWWGMKNHCTFCGLNGTAMDFRTKPPERTIEDIRTVMERWDPSYISFTDNIMPLGYFKTLLPEMATWEEKPGLFYEVKANLKYDQLALMRDAGMVQIQPGIESLSTNVLKLMRKGVSALKNLCLLRDATSIDLHVLWNILYGFPGEEVEDYAPLPVLFALIEHFRPPEYMVPIVVDRFSPHHNDPVGFGIGSYRPYPGFAALFPPEAPVMDLAYHFIAEQKTALMRDEQFLERFHAAYEAWRDQWEMQRPPMLAVLPMGSDIRVIVDTRRVAKRRMTALTPATDEMLRHFEQPRRRDQIAPEMAEPLAALVADGFVVEHEGYYLSIVTRPILQATATSRRSLSLLAN